MQINEVKASVLQDSRGDSTISVKVITSNGVFESSSPSGKSKGQHEAKSYIKSPEGDAFTINTLASFLKNIAFKEFQDLKNVENVARSRIGANALFALESSLLKALAKEKKQELWELLREEFKTRGKMPYLVGNAIGGGLHSKGKKPDFQEFLFIPLTSVKEGIEINKEAHMNALQILQNVDKKFEKKKNDENAWQTSLSNEKVLEVMEDVRENIIDEYGVKFRLGIDVASSSFYKGIGKLKEYIYRNPMKMKTREKQMAYLYAIDQHYKLEYLEDPLEENDFDGFALLKSKVKCLVVGDDVTVTNYERLKKAIAINSISALVIKPNQNGSLLDVKKVVDLAKNSNIRIVVSHRSGETQDDFIADLAVAVEADFFKAGILGKEREAKLQRLKKIEETI